MGRYEFGFANKFALMHIGKSLRSAFTRFVRNGVYPVAGPKIDGRLVIGARNAQFADGNSGSIKLARIVG